MLLQVTKLMGYMEPLNTSVVWPRAPDFRAPPGIHWHVIVAADSIADLVTRCVAIELNMHHRSHLSQLMRLDKQYSDR